jgi:hypothetical protein
MAVGKVRKWALTGSASIVTLNFPAPRTEINVCCLSHLVYGILLQQPELAVIPSKDIHEFSLVGGVD